MKHTQEKERGLAIKILFPAHEDKTEIEAEGKPKLAASTALHMFFVNGWVVVQEEYAKDPRYKQAANELRTSNNARFAVVNRD